MKFLFVVLNQRFDVENDARNEFFRLAARIARVMNGNPDEMPDAVPMIGPDKILKEEASKASKTTEKAARKLQRQQTVERPNKAPVSVSAKAARPQEANAQSAPSPTARA